MKPCVALALRPVRLCLSTGPGLLPSRELGRPDLVARKISLVQAQEFSLGDLAKPLALRFFNMLLCPHVDLGEFDRAVDSS